MRSLSNVDATLIPAGNALLKSVSRTPRGESCKQSPGYPCAGIAGVLPTQRPCSHPTPVVRFIFWSRVQPTSRARALACASAHLSEAWSEWPSSEVLSGAGNEAEG